MTDEEKLQQMTTTVVNSVCKRVDKKANVNITATIIGMVVIVISGVTFLVDTNREAVRASEISEANKEIIAEMKTNVALNRQSLENIEQGVTNLTNTIDAMRAAK